MASLFSGADHIDHVKTQLPYVATVGFVIAILYTIFGFTGISPFILLPIGVVMEILLMHLLHKYYLKKYDIHEDYSLSMTADHK